MAKLQFETQPIPEAEVSTTPAYILMQVTDPDTLSPIDRIQWEALQEQKKLHEQERQEPTHSPVTIEVKSITDDNLELLIKSLPEYKYLNPSLMGKGKNRGLKGRIPPEQLLSEASISNLCVIHNKTIEEAIQHQTEIATLWSNEDQKQDLNKDKLTRLKKHLASLQQSKRTYIANIDIEIVNLRFYISELKAGSNIDISSVFGEDDVSDNN